MEQLPNIDLSHGLTGPVLLTLLGAAVAAALRTLIKDRDEKKRLADAQFQRCCRQAYNSVTSRLKREGKEAVGDKEEAGLIALDRFLILARRRPASEKEREEARLIFEAIHGELCPGGTGTLPPTTPGNPSP